MKRLIIIAICLLVPASVFAQQGAGAFVHGFAQGFAATRGHMPPPVYVPPQPQNESGVIYYQGGRTDLYSITQSPITSSYWGTIYGAGNTTTFSGSKY